MLIWLAAAIAAIYLSALNGTPLRIVLTLPVVFFLPGYGLIAALFPKTGEISPMERLMLSVGFSIVVVPLIGLGLNFTPFGIRLEPLVILLVLFTFAMILVAHYRRTLLPPEEQFRIRFSAITGTAREGLVSGDETRVDRFLSSILALVMIIVIIMTIWVIVSPKEGERFSEFYVLNANLTADNYPDRIFPKEIYPLYIGVGNQENRNVSYTVEIWAGHVETDKITNTMHYLTMDPADRLDLTLADNETRLIPYNLSVSKKGYNRMDFLLFNETVPGPGVTGIDRVRASYRDVHLWITG